jgi:phosphohistidine phosphatase
MKQLFVVRHAKSSWDHVGLSDFQRPLNKRGTRDAPDMAKRLWNNGFRIDGLISSPATRAFTTAEHFAMQFGFTKKDILSIDRLYHADVETFYDVITKEMPANWSHALLFSHNPGITYFINSTGLVSLDNMPTCAVFGIEADCHKWEDFEKAKKKFLLFDYPKNGL